MKRIYLTLITLFMIGSLGIFTACSNDDDENSYVISFEELPSESQSFINVHFADYSVTKATEKTSGYSVSLSKNTKDSNYASAGYEIEFDRNGNWIEIEGRNDAVLPDDILALIPRDIISYVNQNHSPRGITEIKKESYGYKIDLTGKPDLELMFDINGGYLGDDTDGNDTVITYEQLPADARAFLNTHFNGMTPSRITKDSDSYEVKYANKTEVEFDILGKWYEVDVNGNGMPETVMSLLPEKVNSYLKSNYASKKIESVKNNISTYEIELEQSIKLVFDKDGNLWNSNNGGSSTGNGKKLGFSDLPQSIQQYLTNNFLNDTKFLYAERDDDEYEVKLANGTDIEFSLSGELKSIEVLPGNKVPDSIVLKPILDYTKANYSNRVIEEYEKETFGYKVELSGYPKVELVFDLNGSFKKIDR